MLKNLVSKLAFGFLFILVVVGASPFLGLAILEFANNLGSPPSLIQPVTKASPDVINDIAELSVTIDTGSAQGSGVIVNRGKYSFVLTAGHVISDSKTVRKTINDCDVIEFDDVNVLRDISSYGRKIGQTSVAAKVICYSDPNYGEDLAVLLVRQEGFSYKAIEFYDTDSVPQYGAKLYHVGSFRGKNGSNSLSDGLVSYIGRVYEGSVYDQTSCTAFPGSSGGGMFLRDTGEYVGMIVLGSGETYNLIVPVRRIKKWVDNIGMSFLLDPTLPVPDEDTLSLVPIEYPTIENKVDSEIDVFDTSENESFERLPYIE